MSPIFRTLPKRGKRRQRRATILAAVIIVSSALLVAAPRIPLAAEQTENADRLSRVYAMYAAYREQFPGVTDIAPRKAKALFDRGELQFVDVRTPAEIGVSTLPGAIDKAVFLEDPAAYQNKAIVVFCTIGYRSGRFAQEMGTRGVDVTNLSGGILAWMLEGGQVFHQGMETERLHVYGPKWDLAPVGIETIRFGLLERLTQ